MTRLSLERRLALLAPPRARRRRAHIATGYTAIDRQLDGGISRGALHEVLAIHGEQAGSTAGFAAMLARRAGGPLVWLRTAISAATPSLYGPGLCEVGLDPAETTLVSAPDPKALLRAANDVVRCTAVTVAVIELERATPLLDLTASRRLLLAAEASGVTVLLLRPADDCSLSVAHTRWAVAPAPSAALPANAPGSPAFEISLLRQRGGPDGQRWLVEWDRDRCCFRAPLSGAVVPLPGIRSLGGGSSPAVRRVG